MTVTVKPEDGLDLHRPAAGRTMEQIKELEDKRKVAWMMLQTELPEGATRHIDDGPNKGLEDINDAYIHERLLNARLDGLEVYYEEPRMNNLGKTTVTFKRGTAAEYEVEEWVVECDWPIIIDGLRVVGTGAHQTADLGNARKGAKTSAFKDTLKYFGIALEVRKRGRSEDIRTSGGGEARKSAKLADAEMNEKVRAAYKEKGKEWPECTVHGDTVTMKRTKKGDFVISCTGKGADGSFCNHFKAVWDNNIPPYYKAIAETALAPATSGMTGNPDDDVDPDDVHLPFNEADKP